MGNRYVDVTITRQTQAVSQKGFGLPLILATSKSLAYKEYEDLSGIGTDYGTTSKAYKIAEKIFGQEPKVEKVAVYGVAYTPGATGTSPADLSAALDTLVQTHNGFYYLVSDQIGDAEVTELTKWTGTKKKLYFASTISKTLGSTLANNRAVLLAHNDAANQFPGESWVGVGAPRIPGSFTWTFKTLNGVTVANYGTTDIGTIEGNNMSTYIKEGGVNITSKGVTTSGEYIDIMQGTDYIEATMIENVYGLLVRSPKIPFTDGGIAQVVSEVEKSLVDATRKGIIATDADGQPLFTVTAPTAAEVSDTNKANRTLPDVKWTATLAGAVENVDINGVLQL